MTTLVRRMLTVLVPAALVLFLDVFLRIEAGKVIGRQRVDNRNKVPADVPAPLRIGD